MMPGDLNAVQTNPFKNPFFSNWTVSVNMTHFKSNTIRKEPEDITRFTLVNKPSFINLTMFAEKTSV